MYASPLPIVEMRFVGAVVSFISILINGSWTLDYYIPRSFKLGAMTSAYEVEGGWDADGKSPNNFDHAIHTKPQLIIDRTNGDVASDSYHQWKRDINIAGELGLDVYRFSISWSRLLPTGFANNVSEAGKRYYNNLINGLLERGIEPVVTIYHWDLPQNLYDLGGWFSPLISNWFQDYAQVCFSLFGDRVKIWLTIHDPNSVCSVDFSRGAQIVDNDNSKVARYSCNKNVLLAHAKAYRVYDNNFRHVQYGKVSISIANFWMEPASSDDYQINKLAHDYWFGRYLHPIFTKQGGWPRELEQKLLENSLNAGFLQSRLPSFTSEEIELIKGTHDFFALCHYGSRQIHKVKPGETPGLYPLDGTDELNVTLIYDPSWKNSSADWYKINPIGIRKQLHWLVDNYEVEEIFITGIGLQTADGTLKDTERVEHITDYLEQILIAMTEGIPVIGHIYFALIDGFEFFSGHLIKMGLYSIDFKDSDRAATPRYSALFYANLTKSRILHIDGPTGIILVPEAAKLTDLPVASNLLIRRHDNTTLSSNTENTEDLDIVVNETTYYKRKESTKGGLVKLKESAPDN